VRKTEYAAENMQILHIDDDSEDSEYLFEALSSINRSIGFQTATDGLKALKILDSTKMDFIFLDINMPIMNGRECIEKIKNDANFRKIPVVVLSTTINQSEVESFNKFGVYKFLKKPINYNLVKPALENILSGNFYG
jgi:CheY-like chemotaxis protein